MIVVYADVATNHEDTNNTYTNTTAGPLKITDFCPGVEYLLHQNNTNTTFLQVNVSDCENNALAPTAQRGVVYGKHVDCNLKVQCEGGRDETEHCAFSSPHCQGLVASRNKCFQLSYVARGLHIKHSQYECQGINGRLASIQTRKEQADLLHLFENYFEFLIVIGSVSGWHSVPFLYSMFRKWTDNTLIYNVGHFIVEEQYIPSREVHSMVARSMVFERESFTYETIMCEVKLQTERGYSSHTSLGHFRSSKSILTATQQSLFLRQGRNVTHQFLSCDSPCIKATHLKHCAVMNVSSAQLSDMSVSERRLQCSDTLFGCGDDTTKVHHTLLCDFRQDCPDGTDESCEHPSCSGFLCSNGQCVLSSQRCNQYSDCLDDSDEIECPDDSSYLVWFKDDDKKLWVYVSLDGTGYFTRHVMSADQLCPDSHYPCQTESLYCLPVYTRCNGFADCVHGEDEQDCETVTCPGFYRCRSSTVCVHGHHLCDGWGQCPQRDDELMCDFTCPESCLCQGHAFLCNKPFPSDRYSQLRYLDATGSNMSLADFDRNAYLVHLKLSQCFISNVSHTNYVLHGKYLQCEKAWTDSAPCRLAGFLSFLASEVSVLMICFITLHHTVIFCFPAQSWRFSGTHFTSAACVVAWVVGFLLAAVPFLPGLSHWGLHGQSGLCRLALFDGHHSGRRFRWFTVTVVVNSIFSLVTVAAQAVTYRRTPQYRTALSATQRSVFSSVHAMRRLAVTNAVCWIAFLLATIVRTYDVEVFSRIHDTMVVFVLPFNSAINPLLYLWTAKTQWQRQQQEEKLIQVLKFRLAQSGKCYK
ncbi:hypothetical protein ACOMHN_033198 [Nucella lapillus]